MEIQTSPEFRKQILTAVYERELHQRSGTHASDLIYCLNKQALRRLNPAPPSEDELLLFSLGWASQRWLTGRTEDEPTVEVDGIQVTPDAQMNGVIWELKCTYMSSNNPIEEQLHWLRQLMAQCHVTKTLEANLSRLELMGDWGSIFPKGKTPEEKKANKLASKKPTLSAWHFVFTPKDIADNWTWMVARRDKFLAILETGKLLPRIEALPAGESYECNYCKYEGVQCLSSG